MRRDSTFGARSFSDFDYQIVLTLLCTALRFIAFHSVSLHYIALLHILEDRVVLITTLSLHYFALHCVSLRFIAPHGVSLRFIALLHILKDTPRVDVNQTD